MTKEKLLIFYPLCSSVSSVVKRYRTDRAIRPIRAIRVMFRLITGSPREA
jgi:hypothetical protein